MAGLAQKNGAVSSHMKLAARPGDIQSIRLAAGGADLVLGCDVMVTGAQNVLNLMGKGRTSVVVNTHETMPATFTRDADYRFPSARLARAISERVGAGHMHPVEGSRLATALIGDAIASNLFMLGYAYQQGLVPVSADAIMRAITLNNVAVEMNTQAFTWGRRAAHDLAQVENIVAPKSPARAKASDSLDEMIARREAFLGDYQNAAYGARYRALVEKVREAEAARAPGKRGLAEAVARYYFKLLAIKDEYEVARLYTDGSFTRALSRRFAGDYKIKLHLAPPLLARRDETSGHLRKTEFGPWMMQAMRLLAALKGLRGSPLDVFGYSAERRRERALIGEYEGLIGEIVSSLNGDNHKAAVDLASVPEQIRGFGHVKERHIEEAMSSQAALLKAFRGARSDSREAA